MDIWKTTIKMGNQRFANSEFVGALAFYNTAKSQAEDLFQHWPNADEAVSALVVTYHNIADLYIKQGTPNLAVETIEKAKKILLRELAREQLDPKRHDALCHGSRKLHSALMRYKRCHLLSTLH